MSNGRRRALSAAQRGFTYLTALLLVAVSGAVLTAFSESWSHSRSREKEAELFWIGNQFRQAIGLYYQRAPDAVKRYPAKLEDLLEDARFPNPQRYLRKIYPDPMTGKADWKLIPAIDGGIMGVESSSTTAKILLVDPRTGRDANWRFVYEPPATIQAPQADPAKK